MTGLTVQNFLSAAIGIVVAFARQGVKTLGICLDRYRTYYTLSATTTSNYFWSTKA